ncbi:Peptide chain release factor 1 [Weissella viridescens]|uniref:Peptide chain release factor 1 n=1 Tax=Weissella viridescens TaxID=1629 RepID=A0A380NX79_WEIVI|nr:Peptide chain release factor 1 [Weissella viridescens]
MTKGELKELESEKSELEERLKILLLPKDPNDDKNIIMEIHGAAGGDEGLCLLRTYTKCTAVMLNAKTGMSKSLMKTRLKLADTKKSF